MKETPTLKTARLTLRPFTMDDVDNVYRWCSSWTNTQFLFWYPHRDKSVTERLVKTWIRKKRNYSWALDDGTGAIGEIQVIKDLPNGGFEVGYILLEEKWHQGFMKEALVGVLRYLFLQNPLLFSEEETDSRNVASRHLLESVGYVFTGTKEGVYIAKKNETVTESFYHLSKEDFLAKFPPEGK